MVLLLPLLFIFNVFAFEECVSTHGEKIEYFERPARETGLKKRILVFGQIHGDEPESGDLANEWMARLKKITPSNHWRIVPILNPDGTKKKTRFNANGVDLNRNFPTKDWESEALLQWKTVQKSDPRRYPGKKGGEESETKCAIKHIEDFRPDIVISLHTPYGLFDFDGPEGKRTKSNLLPWKRLGTFPGSLGRYLWDERGIPVLTVELRMNSFQKNRREFIAFQDQLSDLLIVD